MKDMYVIEKELHRIGGIEIKIANADLFDAESGEWTGHVAKDGYFCYVVLFLPVGLNNRCIVD